MTDSRDDHGEPVAGAPRNPPDLPKGLVDLVPPVVIGTVLWTMALAVSLLLRHLADKDVWLWPETSLAGIGLGFVGLGIIAWQRRAARRGSRGAQRGL